MSIVMDSNSRVADLEKQVKELSTALINLSDSAMYNDVCIITLMDDVADLTECTHKMLKNLENEEKRCYGLRIQLQEYMKLHNIPLPDPLNTPNNPPESEKRAAPPSDVVNQIQEKLNQIHRELIVVKGRI